MYYLHLLVWGHHQCHKEIRRCWYFLLQRDGNLEFKQLEQGQEQGLMTRRSHMWRRRSLEDGDPHSHGTIIASKAAGRRYGLAKQVRSRRWGVSVIQKISWLYWIPLTLTGNYYLRQVLRLTRWLGKFVSSRTGKSKATSRKTKSKRCT